MRRALLLAGALGFALGCGDNGTGPGPAPDGDGARLAGQLDGLADSVDAGGYSPAAEALHHAAEIVRLTGHATPVSVSVDGVAKDFLGVGEQIDFPNLVCTWPTDSGVAPPPDTAGVPLPDTTGVFPPQPPDSIDLPPIDSGALPPGMPPIPVDSGVIPPPPIPECHEEGSFSLRTLIAWEPEHLNEVVRLVAYLGSSGVEPGVPDVMAGLPGGSSETSPPTAPPDSGSGSGGEPGGFPGFMGEYLVRDVGSWYAIEGTQTNDIVSSGGSCTADRATFDWAQFDCAAARYRFEFSMKVEPAPYGPLTDVAESRGEPQGTHHLAMSASEIDGVRLTWRLWNPPPLPPDTAVAE
ncbi:MAG: hypothetical protein ACJ8CN_12915 [Gemmatimonadales bacterium]